MVVVVVGGRKELRFLKCRSSINFTDFASVTMYLLSCPQSTLVYVSPLARNHLAHSNVESRAPKKARALLSSNLDSVPGRHNEQHLDQFADYDGGQVPDMQDTIVLDDLQSDLTSRSPINICGRHPMFHCGEGGDTFADHVSGDDHPS